MSGDIDYSHPARKIDLNELIEVLAELNETTPALRAPTVAQKFPEVDPQTVRNNLDYLAEAGDICRFNDGDSKFYWFPREEDEAGTVTYNEVMDDSIDWKEVDVSTIPVDVAEEIAEERLPYYRTRSFWSKGIGLGQVGIIGSFGVVILGIGGLVGGTLGVGQAIGALLFRVGLISAVIFLVIYSISSGLDYLAGQGTISKGPPIDLFDSED
jgi:hypothetical protein